MTGAKGQRESDLEMVHDWLCRWRDRASAHRLLLEAGEPQAITSPWEPP